MAAAAGRAAATLRQARVLAARGERDAAVELLAPLRDDPEGRAPARLIEAGLLLDERDFHAAESLYRQAVAEAPRSCAALDGLARCLHAQGRDVEALVAAQRARELLGEGDNFRYGASVSLTLLWCLREQRRFREALAVAEEGLRRWPDAILAHWANQVQEELAEAEQERC